MNDNKGLPDSDLSAIAECIENKLNGGATGKERAYVFVLAIYPNSECITEVEDEFYILTHGIELKNTISLLESTVKLLKGQI